MPVTLEPFVQFTCFNFCLKALDSYCPHSQSIRPIHAAEFRRRWLLQTTLHQSKTAKFYNSNSKQIDSRRVYVIYTVTCQAHPVLVKKTESNVQFVSFLNFCLGSYLACLLLSV